MLICSVLFGSWNRFLVMMFWIMLRLLVVCDWMVGVIDVWIVVVFNFGLMKL